MGTGKQGAKWVATGAAGRAGRHSAVFRLPPHERIRFTEKEGSASTGVEFLRRLGSLRGVLLLVAVLVLPTLYLTLFSPFQFAADDFWHLLASDGKSYPGGPTRLDMYRFASGHARDTLAGMQDGTFPWYTEPTLKIWFWRPLSTALHHVDQLLFGKSALGARLHSLTWYVGLVVLVRRLYQRFSSRQLASLGIIVFTCTAAHWQPAAWMAARNAVVSATLSCAALLCHLEWREKPRALGLVRALLVYLLAIAAGESAFSVVAYIAGYELAISTGSLRRRAAAVLPFAGVSVIALALYSAAGYGTHGSGAYLDPLGEPTEFLAELPARFVSMLGFSYLGLPADMWFLESKLRPTYALLGAVAGAVVCAGFGLTWRQLSVAEHRACAWMGISSTLAILPQLGGQLGSRSLTLPSIGTSVVIAGLVLGAWRTAKILPRGSSLRWVALSAATLGAIFHVVVASASWLVTPLFYAESMRKVAASVERLNLDDSAEKRAMLLQVPDMFIFRYLPFQRRTEGRTVPKTWHSLSQASYDHLVRRTGPSSFELEVVGGQMLESPLESVVRTAHNPFKVGDSVKLDDFTVKVLEVGPVGPRRITVECATSLEDASWLFLVWQNGQLQRFTFPAIGRSVRLRWSPGPTALEL